MTKLESRLTAFFDKGPWRLMAALACWTAAMKAMIDSDPTPAPTVSDWFNLGMFFVWIGFGIKILWKGIR